MTEIDLLESLVIYSVQRRERGGVWVDGRIADHTFTALVFEGRAHMPEWEMDGGSRISKFHLRANDDRTIVANFDRGWDVHPTTPAAKQITDLLSAGLAEHVFS